MASAQYNINDIIARGMPDATGMRVGIVVSEWNDRITDSLLNGAKESLMEHGIKAENIHVHYVPGSFELPLGAKWMLEYTNVDAVICIGCIIQGETRHFDFIAQAVADGIMNVGLKFSKPVIFSVLTCNTMEQAEDRSGGKHGNKGVEGAVSALKMLSLSEKI